MLEKTGGRSLIKLAVHVTKSFGGTSSFRDISIKPLGTMSGGSE